MLATFHVIIAVPIPATSEIIVSPLFMMNPNKSPTPEIISSMTETTESISILSIAFVMFGIHSSAAFCSIGCNASPSFELTVSLNVESLPSKV